MVGISRYHFILNNIKTHGLYLPYFAPALALASSAAATAGLTFFPSFQRTRGGGALFLLPSRERTRTTV
jgi:hypothetical protein